MGFIYLFTSQYCMSWDDERTLQTINIFNFQDRKNEDWCSQCQSDNMKNRIAYQYDKYTYILKESAMD